MSEHKYHISRAGILSIATCSTAIKEYTEKIIKLNERIGKIIVAEQLKQRQEEIDGV